MIRKGKKRALRLLLRSLAALLVLAGIAIGVLRFRLNGPPLAGMVEQILNKGIRGHVEIGSIEWPLGSLPTAITGGWIPITIHGLRVYDDGGQQGQPVPLEERELVLRADSVTGFIDIHSFLFGHDDLGNNDFVVRDLVIAEGGYVLLRQVADSHPMNDHDSSVMSLVSAFSPPLELHFRAGMSAASAGIFDIRSFQIRGATLELALPGMELRAETVHAEGFFVSDFSDPLKGKMYYSLAPTAERGVLRIGGEDGAGHEIPLEDIRIDRLAQLPLGWPRDTLAHDLLWKLAARTPAGTRIQVEGGLLDYWAGSHGGDYDIRLAVDHGGPLLETLSGSMAGGDDLSLALRLHGPSIGPRFELELRGLDVRVPAGAGAPPLDLEIARARAAYDLVTGQGSLEDTVARGVDGEVHLAATFGLDPLHFDIHADIARPVQVGPYLPPDVRTLAGDALRGRLRLVGDASRQQLDTLDLWLGRAHITGELVAEGGRTLHARRVKVELGQSEVTSSGTVDLLSGRFDLGVSVASRDVPVWLRFVGGRPLASGLAANGVSPGGLTGTARLTGTADDPRVRAKVALTGMELLRQLDIDVGYGNGVVSLHQATSRGLGGSLWARGRVRLGKTPHILDLDARASELDLGRVPQLGGLVAGRVDATMSARGPVSKLDTELAASVDGLAIAGDTYRFAATPSPCEPRGKRPQPAAQSIQLCTQPDGSKVLAFAVERGGGGNLDVHAMLQPDGRLGGTVAMNALPLQQLGALGGVRESPVGGEVSTRLALGGSLDAPTVAGNVDWFHAWFERTFLGPGTFEVRPLGPGLIGLEGTLLQGDVRVSGRIRTVAPYDSELHIELRRVELDRFAPAQAREHKTRGWLTGTIDATMPLVPTPGRPPRVQARFTELELWLDNDDSHGRPTPIRVRNDQATPLALHYDGAKVRLTEPVTLLGPEGASFALSGSGDPDHVDLRLDGTLAIGMFQPYVRDYFDTVSGTLAMKLALRGPVAKPEIVLDLELLSALSVRPVGQEAVLSLSRGGLVKITNDQIAPTGLFVNVEDPYTGERATLKIGGGVKLEEFVPRSLGLIIEGELPGKLLLVLAPEVFSRASGMARVEMGVSGDPRSPRPYGEISFATEQPLALMPRGLRREIRLTGGEISFIGNEVELIDIVGTVDDEGQIRGIKGPITFEQLQPVSLDLSVSADSLPFRQPGALDLTLNINDMSIVGNVEHGLDVRGVIEVVDGRYIRNFNLITGVLTPELSDDTSQPFYEGLPLIADARLGLTIDTRGFFVQNNLATIQLIGELGVSGTPRDPRLDGEIRVEQGTFKLPGLRSRFTRTRGTVSFSGYKKILQDTPVLDLQSESEYRDPGGQEHLVTLSITGPLSTLNWDLYTSSGLNKGQTMTMLVSGRTPEEFRKSLGDEAVGDPTRVDPSTSPSENVADQLLRDLAGDFISLLIEDKLRNLTTLDVARLEIGTGSIGFHGEKELVKNLKILTDLEQTLRGRTVDVRGQYRLSDKLSLEGEYLDKNFVDDSEEDISAFRLRAVLRYFWP